MAIQIGDVLGDYQVTGVLGRGGMGKVFRVRSLLTEREEAMKIVLPDLEEDPALADRFLREMKVHASLQHPNIAALHAAQRIGDRLVMILELVEGVSLEQALRNGPLDARTSVRYLCEVLEALAFAHQRGVIHRDIKPANILIARSGVVKITDFGIARASGATKLTGTGLTLGTLAYMAPEQIVAAKADARSDIYSLGLTAYEMVTGRPAIEGATEHALMNAQLHTLPLEPVTIDPLLPHALSDSIMRAIAKEPGSRFQTAREFTGALRGIEFGAVESVPPVPTKELGDIEARLARAIGPIARRLVAEAALRYGTAAEIRQTLAAQIEDPSERAAFLRDNASATVTMAQHTPPAPVVFDPAMLERLTQALAGHLGPIAKLMVARAVRGASNVQDLESILAAEISDAAERQQFLTSVRRR